MKEFDLPLEELPKELISFFDQYNDPYKSIILSEIDVIVKNPKMYEKSEGKLWISEEGCIAGFYHPWLMIENEPACYFGVFELKTQKAQSLISSFESWAKSKSAKKVYGPINYNTYFHYRLKSTEHEPFFLEPQNPKYYLDKLITLGYEIDQEYVSYDLGELNSFMEEFRQTFNPDNLQGLKDQYEFKTLTKEFWMQNLDKIYELSDEIFKSNFAYAPLGVENFQQKYGETFIEKCCLKTSNYVLKDGEIVGMCVNFPDYLRPESKTVLVKTAGVKASHRHMGMPFMLMIADSLQKAISTYNHVIICLMKEGNFPSIITRSHHDALRKYALLVKFI